MARVRTRNPRKREPVPSNSKPSGPHKKSDEELHLPYDAASLKGPPADPIKIRCALYILNRGSWKTIPRTFEALSRTTPPKQILNGSSRIRSAESPRESLEISKIASRGFRRGYKYPRSPQKKAEQKKEKRGV
ncbi:hypothetical protein Salat_1099400 [Sesamum alatum]|uniref:Uncharacterized protein n=1 Tax=Sesamum alatum TaxID=300844 RepID=A0AAE2CSX1_9LAMI|nr:hypothetical protein Salat_1099400 [Sesamum alatum]